MLFFTLKVTFLSKPLVLIIPKLQEKVSIYVCFVCNFVEWYLSKDFRHSGSLPFVQQLSLGTFLFEHCDSDIFHGDKGTIDVSYDTGVALSDNPLQDIFLSLGYEAVQYLVRTGRRSYLCPDCDQDLVKKKRHFGGRLHFDNFWKL